MIFLCMAFAVYLTLNHSAQWQPATLIDTLIALFTTLILIIGFSVYDINSRLDRISRHIRKES